ncbi:hypothetical protein TJA_12980 [Thermus sp. LT1-2-5]
MDLGEAPPHSEGTLQPLAVGRFGKGKEEPPQEDQDEPCQKGQAEAGKEGKGEEESPRVKESQGTQGASYAKPQAQTSKGGHRA